MFDVLNSFVIIIIKILKNWDFIKWMNDDKYVSWLI